MDAAATDGAGPDSVAMADAGESGASVDGTQEEGGLICRRLKVPGSNFKKKVCATAEQWGYSEHVHEQGQEYLRKGVRSQSAITSN